MNGPRPLAIGGSPRSGTTLLQRIVDSHPDVSVSKELGCFFGIDKPAWYGPAFVLRLARDRGRLPEPFHDSYRDSPAMTRANLRFAGQMLRAALGPGHRRLDAAAAEAGLRAVFPDARVVGDKFPRYVDRLDSLAADPGLDIVMIYRDARDVVSSTLAKARGQWRGERWARALRDPAFVAADWVRAVERVERHRSTIQVVCYETMLRDPATVFEPLANRLDIDPRGFDVSELAPSSIGNHRTGLTAAELDEIMAVAAPTLDRLGYLADDR